MSLTVGLAVGLLVALPIGAVAGIAGYFWLIAEADRQGGLEATRVNRERARREGATWV